MDNEYRYSYHKAPTLSTNQKTYAKVGFKTTIPNQVLFLQAHIEGFSTLDTINIGKLNNVNIPNWTPDDPNTLYSLNADKKEILLAIEIPVVGINFINISHFKRSSGVETKAKFRVVKINQTWLSQKNSESGVKWSYWIYTG